MGIPGGELVVTREMVYELAEHTERAGRSEETAILLDVGGWGVVTVADTQERDDAAVAVTGADVLALTAEYPMDDDMADYLATPQGRVTYQIPDEAGRLILPPAGTEWRVVSGVFTKDSPKRLGEIDLDPEPGDTVGGGWPLDLAWENAFWIDYSTLIPLIGPDEAEARTDGSWSLYMTPAGTCVARLTSNRIEDFAYRDAAEAWVKVSPADAVWDVYKTDAWRVREDLPAPFDVVRELRGLVARLEPSSVSPARAERDNIRLAQFCGGLSTLVREDVQRDIRTARSKAAQKVVDICETRAEAARKMTMDPTTLRDLLT